ncbi:MAG TPA: hypothetical protein PKE30_17505, partial [Niabella sp.]|nr:hypothetical protein [Niabella sp.]
AVEKHLEYTKGFWGMIAAGYRLSDLLGKNNPQTDALRFIENIVGPVQSLLWGHLSVDDFEQYTQHINFRMPSNILTACVAEARQLFNYWNQLVMGQQLVLEWTLPINQELKISI